MDNIHEGNDQGCDPIKNLYHFNFEPILSYRAHDSRKDILEHFIIIYRSFNKKTELDLGDLVYHPN